MTDIFLSYAKTDRRYVEPIVALLEGDGLQVWWDKRLGGGEQWDEVIERELKAAKCVIVVWSSNSISSRWVRSEASVALERGALVPVTIQGAPPPLAFTLIQATDLTKWDSRHDSEEAMSLLSAVRAKIGAPPPVPKQKEDRLANFRPELSTKSPNPRASSKFNRNIWLALASLCVAAIITANWWWFSRQTSNISAGDAFQDCSACPSMLAVAQSEFTMGEKNDGAKWEGPPHQVSLKGLLGVGRFEVTNQQYVTFLNAMLQANQYDQAWVLTEQEDSRSPLSLALRRVVIKGGYENHPVGGVSWRGAKAYVAWVSNETGKRYRLPTEAEWEYAARANVAGRLYFGVDVDKYCEHGNVQDRAYKQKNPSAGAIACLDGYSMTAPIGRFKPNGFGLYDILGNVWEWVEDCWNDHFEGAPTDGSAWTTGDCSKRVIRGGSFEVTFFSISGRASESINRRYMGLGLRVVRDMPQ